MVPRLDREEPRLRDHGESLLRGHSGIAGVDFGGALMSSIPMPRPDNNPEVAFSKSTYPLRRQTIDHLSGAGVPLDLYPIRTAAIAVHRSRFYLPGEMRCPDDLVNALVFPCLDTAGNVFDLAAFVPTTGELFTWLGCAWTIDEQHYPSPLSVLREDGAIELFKSPLDWLRHDMRGLVIVDPAKARWQLLRDGVPLIAQNLTHARELRAVVEIARPQILLPRQSNTRSAA